MIGYIPNCALRLAVLAVLAQTAALGLNSSTATLTVSPSPSIYGQPVTLTASVTSGATGKVTFYDGVTMLGGGTVSAGQAILRTIALPSGVRSLHAYYQGDGAYAPSSSLPVSETVVVNPALLLRRPVTYTTNVQGLAMVTADFNGDGNPDLVLAPSYNSFSVFLGDGNGGFQAGSTYATAGPVGGMVVADFNGDGRPDLATTIPYAGIVDIYIANPDGTFQPPISSYAGMNPAAVAVGDFNGDGNADLAIANQYESTVTILLGNGDGTFQYGICAVDHDPTEVMIGDFNGDGRTDLAIVADQKIDILIGAGDGTFEAGGTYPIGTLDGVLVGDFNGDGHADLLVVGDASVYVLPGKGDGTFGAALASTAQGLYSREALGDFNGDGIVDLVAFDAATAAVAVMKGNGDGTFQAQVNYPADTDTASLVVGDFNSDGRTDVVISGYSGVGIQLYRGSMVPDPPRSDPTISVSHIGSLTQGQTGAYYTITVTNAGQDPTLGEISATISLPSGLNATSLTGNNWSCSLANLFCSRNDQLPAGAGYPDLTLIFNVATNISGNVTTTFTVAGGADDNAANNFASDTAFVRYPTVTTLAVSPNPAVLGHAVTLTSTVTAGATGSVTFFDGVSAIGSAPLVSSTAQFTANQLPSGVQSLRAQYVGDSTYGPSTSPVRTETITSSSNGLLQPATIQTDVGPQWVGIGDFNGDGIPDLVIVGSTVTVFPGKGDGTYGIGITTATGGSSGVVGDFDGDGRLDVAIAATSGVWILLGNGDGTFRPNLIASGPYYQLLAADFNNDGKLDLLAQGGGIVLFTSNGDGTFQSPVYVAGGFDSLAVGDMNGDGRPDLIGRYGDTVTVLLATATGVFQDAGSFSANITGNGMAVGDFNGDGRLDVAITSYSGIAVLLGNGDGTLKTAIQSSMPSSPGNFTIAADFNGDGNLDLAFTEYSFFNQVYIALGKGDGTFSPAVTLNTPGNSYSLAQADLNLDGKVDLAVTNASPNPEATSGSVSLFFGTQYSGLSISGTHRDRFTAGQTGTYQVTVSNYEFAPAVGTVTVSDKLPSGLTAAAISGDGWNCTLATVTCTASGAFPFGFSYPTITITVNVSGSLPPSVVTNVAQVSNGGNVTQSSDPTEIALPTTTSLSVVPVPTALGQPVTLTATVTTGATGFVHFFDGISYLGGAALNGTQATLVTRLMAVGQRSLSAVYTGDASYSESFSAPQLEPVKAAPSAGLEPAITFATGMNPVALAMADFDDDGKADLVTANQSAGTVSILLSNGDGTFGSHKDFPACSTPSAVVVADFNNDGITDIAVSSQSASQVCILLGNGDGTFQAPLSYTVSYSGLPIIAGDYWGDGKTELWAGDANGNLTIVSVTSAGSLQGIDQPALLGNNLLFLGDFNNDGKPDILSLWGNFLEVYLGNGGGTFQEPSFPNSATAYNATLGDMNADGKLDIVASVFPGIDVLLGNGDGTFMAAIQQSMSPPWGLTTGDINGDGKLDVVTTFRTANVVGVSLGNGDGTLQQTIYYPVGSTSGAIVSGDFNGDGATDVAVVNTQGNCVSILLGAKLPELGIASSHTDPFGLGENGAQYTISVVNNGPGATAGIVTVSDTLPSGLKATSMSGTDWNCTLATLTCTSSDSLAAGAHSAITVTLDVGTNAPSSGSNFVTISGGTAAGASASDLTTIVAGTAITVQTSPTGLQFSIDNKAPMSAPQTLYLTQGNHIFAVATPQAGAVGTQYVFTGWSDSDSEAATRTIDITNTVATYVESFKTQYQLTASALPEPGGTVSPAPGDFFDAGTTVIVTASPRSPYAFNSWSGAGLGSTNPISIVMNAAESITANFGVPGFSCAVAGDGTASVTDVQFIIYEALGISRPADDLNRDGVVNLVDVQKVIGAAMGMGCVY